MNDPIAAFWRVATMLGKGGSFPGDDLELMHGDLTAVVELLTEIRDKIGEKLTEMAGG